MNFLGAKNSLGASHLVLPEIVGVEAFQPLVQPLGIVLVGAGVGITPMMSVVRYLHETGWPGQVYLVLGFRSPRDFIFRRSWRD